MNFVFLQFFKDIKTRQEKELYVLENKNAVSRQLVISEENSFCSCLPNINMLKRMTIIL